MANSNSGKSGATQPRELAQIRLESALPHVDRGKLPFDFLQEVVRGIYTHLPQDDGYLRMVVEAKACYGCGEPLCRSAVDGACPLRNPMNTAHQLITQGFSEYAFRQWRLTSPAMEWMSCCNRCVRRCTSGHQGHPIQIGFTEHQLGKLAFDQGWWEPARPILGERDEHIIFVGSGPGTIGALDLLRTAGFKVTVLERSDLPFGLVWDGIHHRHIDKTLLNRRLKHHKDSGVNFHFGIDVGSDNHPVEFENGKVTVYLDRRRNSKVTGNWLVLSLGASVPLDYPNDIPGRRLKGVHPAMEVIADYNRMLTGAPRPNPIIDSEKCYQLSTAGAGLTAIDGRLMGDEIGDHMTNQFIRKGPIDQVRPHWTSPPDSREDVVMFDGGGTSRWKSNVVAFLPKDPSRPDQLTHVAARSDETGRVEEFPCDLFLIAFGYRGPGLIPGGLAQQLGLSCTREGYIWVDGRYNTSHPRVKAVGDCCRGGLKPDEDLLVHAISDGLRMAEGLLTDAGLEDLIPTIG